MEAPATVDDVPIAGRCDPRFDEVREQFARNFVERGEVGAGLCVLVDGEPVIDLVGGWADADRTRLCACFCKLACSWQDKARDACASLWRCED